MFFNKVQLYKNNALEVSGIESIEIDILNKILVIIGDNGSGKSTIINEINPLPSTQSDYNKGFSKLHITHNSKSYVLESNFKKGLHHSFKEEGVELNSSFKNTIQKDLCESAFQYTPFIHNVITMMYKITKMGPNDRRNLFFNAYPYMNEILNKHKKISSIIKSYQSNLKMLNTRKSELLIEQMKPSDIKELRKKYEELKRDINEIEKILYTLQLENKKLTEELKLININKKLTSEEILELCNSFKRKILHINRNIDYSSLEDKDPNILSNSLFTDKSVLEFKIENIEKNIVSVNKDIEEFESFLRTNSDVDKESLEKSIENLTKILQDINIDPNLPFLSQSVIDKFENLILHDLESHIKHIISVNSKIFNFKVSNNIQNKISQLNLELTNNKSLYDNYLEQFKELKKVTLILPPDDCFNFSCQLKNNSLSTFNNNEERISKIEDILIKLLKEKEQKEKTLDKLYKLISATLSTENSINYINQILTFYGLSGYIYEESNLISFLNKNPINLINKIKVLIKNSKEFLLKQEYEKELNSNRIKLDIINKSPSKQIITNTLLTKQVELNKLLEDYRVSSNSLKDVVSKYSLSKELISIIDKLKDLQSSWEKYSKYLILSKSLEWNRNLENKLIEKKNLLTDNLIGIETTLRKQENISIRLDQEINPNIENIDKTLYKYLLIESALSPYNGIPKKYMIAFINNVIRDVNFYISSILNTDIEIELIDEDSSTVNYIFPVKINGRTISDINKCSKAQSNIIDICLNLALYKQLKLNDNYPLIMDEPDDGFSEGNRTRLLMLLSSMVEQDQIHQLILISHFASMLGGFHNSDIICLSEENIVLPPMYNQNVIIK